MNYLDYLFIGIIILCSLIALSRGLIKTIFSFFSLIIAVLLAYTLYPKISSILFKYTSLYKSLIGKIIKELNLKLLAQNTVSPHDQIDMIKKLKIPNFIKISLVENNNSEVYKVLKATGIEEYIGGAVATIVINALAFLLVFILSILIVKIISHSLDIVSKLPVIHQLNKIGGFFVGFVQGIIIVWIVCIALTVFISFKPNENLFALIESSLIIKIFYNSKAISSVFSALLKLLH